MHAAHGFLAEARGFDVGVDGGCCCLVDAHIGLECFEVVLDDVFGEHVFGLTVHEEDFVPCLFEDGGSGGEVVWVSLYAAAGTCEPAGGLGKILAEHGI